MIRSGMYSSLDTLPRAAYVVTVGTFDGMHLGHQHLLKSAMERGQMLGTGTLVVTFEPSPAQVLRPETFQGRLITIEEKCSLIFESGDAEVVVLPFTKAFACTTADDFLTQLSEKLSVAELWVGEEFAMGKDRQGTIDHLIRLGDSLGFRVTAVPRVALDDEVVSSSRIRSMILAGDVMGASTMLGRRFKVTGIVCEGARLGRTIGFPTANVLPPSDLISLADGIYASFARIEGEPLARPAMTYIGTRPALNPGDRVIETHLFDFDRDIYGAQLATEFVQRLRPDANFESVDALIAQMRRDEQAARGILASSFN